MLSVIDVMISRIQMLDTAMFAIWLLAWTMFAFAAGGIAQGKGHSGSIYFLLGLLLSPLVGMIAAFVLPDRRKDQILNLTARLNALHAPAADRTATAADPMAPLMDMGRPRANVSPYVALAVVVVMIAAVWGVTSLGAAGRAAALAAGVSVP